MQERPANYGATSKLRWTLPVVREALKWLHPSVVTEFAIICCHWEMLLCAVIIIAAPATSSELTDAKKTTSTFLWTTEHSGVRSPTTHRNKREARCWIVNLLSTFLFKARPYLASRILGYHNRPWVPPIIIATDQRGPKRYQTSSLIWYLWHLMHRGYPEQTSKTARENKKEGSDNEITFSRVPQAPPNSFGVPQAPSIPQAPPNSFPSAPHSGVPLIANGSGGFHLAIFPR